MFYRYVCAECGCTFSTNIGEVVECPKCGHSELTQWVMLPKERGD